MTVTSRVHTLERPSGSITNFGCKTLPVSKLYILSMTIIVIVDVCTAVIITHMDPANQRNGVKSTVFNHFSPKLNTMHKVPKVIIVNGEV